MSHRHLSTLHRCGRYPVLPASSGTSRSLVQVPTTVSAVRATAKMPGISWLPALVHECGEPRGRQWRRTPEGPRVAQHVVGTDTNLHNALSVPDAEK